MSRSEQSQYIFADILKELSSYKLRAAHPGKMNGS